MATITSLFEIPLTPQNQNVTVTLGGVAYELVIKYCRGDLAVWMMDVLDPNSQAPIAAGIPLVTGTNLMRQLKYLGIGGAGTFFGVYSDAAIDAPPTYTNLGIQSHLVYGTAK